MRRRTAPCWWMYVLIALLATAVQLGQAAGQTSSANSLTDSQVRDKATNLLRQMTLDEKIAQLSQLPGFPAPEFKENVSKTMEEVLKLVGAGSVLWVPDPKEINRLQHVAVEQSRLHIPVLFGLDVIHGYQTIFPAPLESITAELNRAGRWEGEIIHTRRDGTKVVVASRWSLQRDDQGRPAHP